MKNDVSRHWALLTPFVPGDVLSQQARQVESLGLAGIFVPEMYSSPMMALGFCAAVTERVQLGTGVQNVFASSPFEVAMTAMDLDRLSGGRVVLGVGPSTREWSEGFYGIANYGKPVEHLRETIAVIRLVLARGHTGELDRFDGRYHRFDWSTWLGPFAPPIRGEVPVWVAANQPRLTRLAGEIGDGFIDHPVHGPKWMLTEGRKALGEGLTRAGRDRKDLHWNAWLWVAVNRDRRQAIEDARATVAFYAGAGQYEPMFAKMGFGEEARACADAMSRKEMAACVGAVSDEMAETFIVLGTPDECRRRIEEVWDVADSFCLVPPIVGVPPEKIIFYIGGIADTFYS